MSFQTSICLRNSTKVGNMHGGNVVLEQPSVMLSLLSSTFINVSYNWSKIITIDWKYQILYLKSDKKLFGIFWTIQW